MLELSGTGRINLKEVLRYLGYSGGADFTALQEELNECEKLIIPALSPKACLEEYPVKRIENGALDLGFAVTYSKNLSKNLEGCNKAVLFAATVGSGTDRLIYKYSKLSPSRSLILQAMGAAAIECWCDDLMKEIALRYGKCKPRFSCGFGDLPLDMQRDIFAALPVGKRLGITLSDNLFMTPTKSVTAIVGIKNDA